MPAKAEAQEIENIIIEFFFFCNMAFNNRIVPYKYKYNQMLKQTKRSFVKC